MFGSNVELAGSAVQGVEWGECWSRRGVLRLEQTCSSAVLVAARWRHPFAAQIGSQNEWDHRVQWDERVQDGPGAVTLGSGEIRRCGGDVGIAESGNRAESGSQRGLHSLQPSISGDQDEDNPGGSKKSLGWGVLEESQGLWMEGGSAIRLGRGS
eukprot:3941841-Rhodomonas_salina.4